MASAPLIIPEDFGQLTFHMSSSETAGAVVCTLGVGIGTSNELGDTVNHAAAAWSNLIMPLITNTITFTGASLLARRSNLLERWDSTVEAPQAGGNGPAQLPDNCAILVQKKTAFAGKRNRGRIYMPGVDEGSVVRNTLGEIALIGLQSAWDAFGTELKLDEGTYNAPMLPVILHHSAGAPTEINNFVVQARLATQRGRMRD